MDVNKWLMAVGNKYNRTKRRSFANQHAESKYLKPIGLSLYRRPPATLNGCQNRLPVKEHSAYFEAFHFLKYRAEKAIELRRNTLCIYQNLMMIRNRLVSSNMGLIFRCLQKTRVIHDHGDLSGLGHFSLISAVECFDPWRGYTFGTYACNCILRGFTRVISRRKLKITDGIELNNSPFPNEWDEKEELYQERLMRILANRKGGLTEIEEAVLTYRFCVPINRTKPRKKRLTLQQIGRLKSLSKERIRQLQESGLKKLKKALDLDPIMQ